MAKILNAQRNQSETFIFFLGGQGQSNLCIIIDYLNIILCQCTNVHIFVKLGKVIEKNDYFDSYLKLIYCKAICYDLTCLWVCNAIFSLTILLLLFHPRYEKFHFLSLALFIIQYQSFISPLLLFVIYFVYFLSICAMFFPICLSTIERNLVSLE